MNALKKRMAILCLVCLMAGLLGLAFYDHSLAVPAQAAVQAYTWKNVVTGGGGGYIPGIIFNTGQANLIYARTDMGGAYRWNQGSKTWTQLLSWVPHDDWNLTGVDALATDPVDPNRLYLLVGTYTNDWTSQNGAILRSVDQGNSFARTDLPFKVGGNMPGRNMGERLVIDPNKNNILFLGARSGNGLWKSTDYGVSWSKVSSFPDPGQYAAVPGDAYQGDIMGIAWITFDPRTGSSGSATQTVYVGVADPTGTNIYRTTDGGATWAAVPGQMTCSLSGSTVTCTNGATWTSGTGDCSAGIRAGKGLIPHHGVLSSTGFLYVTYSDGLGPYDGQTGDVWKLDTATGAWTQIAPVPPTTCDDYYGYGGLAVDTQNPGTVMVATLNSWWPDAILFRSTDGGATWSRIWDWNGYPSRTLRYSISVTNAPWLNFGNTSPAEPVPAVKLGWMIGDLEIDPFNSDRMMYGTGATIYGTENLTAWDSGGTVNIASMAMGVEETAVLGLISPPSGSANLLTALGDIGGFRHTDLTTSPAIMFTQPNLGSNTGIDYAELSPTFVVRVGNINKTDNPSVNRAGFSYDGGVSWFQANNEPGGVTGGGSVAAAADASAVVWAPDGAAVSRSTDNGNSWSASTGVPSGAFVASDRVNPSKFYAFSDGSFYVSSNKGASFTATVTGLTSSGKMKAVPGREGDIWLAISTTENGAPVAAAGLYHSTDSGASFTRVLPANITFAEAVGFGMAAPGQSYMAIYIFGTVDGVKGVYRSDDAGASWVMINDAQHQFGWVGKTITGDPRIYGRVYLASNGFGILYGDIAGPQPPTATPTRTATGITATFTATATRTPTGVTPSATSTRTPTGVTPTHTATRTNTLTSTPTTPVTPGSCAVTYVIANSWGSGFTANVTIQNHGSAINGWTLGWAFPGNQAITNIWSAQAVQTGQNVAASDAGYNAGIPANGSVSFGFQATVSGANEEPASFTLNGVVCGGSGVTNTPTNTPTPLPPTATPTRTATGVPPTFTPTATATGATPVTPTATATTPAASGCQVKYTVNQWNSGFTADVKLTNNGAAAIQGWTLAWTFANGQQTTSAWNATVTQSGANVTASNPASHWNGTIAANGGSVSFGFQATHTGANLTPAGFMLNGTPCTLVP
ncbi:MAG: cellulose binding domain-containing protein [Chloroflexota bacterium]